MFTNKLRVSLVYKTFPFELYNVITTDNSLFTFSITVSIFIIVNKMKIIISLWTSQIRNRNCKQFADVNFSSADIKERPESCHIKVLIKFDPPIRNWVWIMSTTLSINFVGRKTATCLLRLVIANIFIF